MCYVYTFTYKINDILDKLYIYNKYSSVITDMETMTNRTHDMILRIDGNSSNLISLP